MTTDELLTTIVAVCVDAAQHIEDGCDNPAELVTSLTGDIVELIEAHDRDNVVRAGDGSIAAIFTVPPINFPRGMW